MNCAASSGETVRMDAGLTAVVEANVSEVWEAWVDWSTTTACVRCWTTPGPTANISHRCHHAVLAIPRRRCRSVCQGRHRHQPVLVLRLGQRTSASIPTVLSVCMRPLSPFKPVVERWCGPAVRVPVFVNKHDVHANARFVEADELDFVNSVTTRSTTEHGEGVAGEERALAWFFFLARFQRSSGPSRRQTTAAGLRERSEGRGSCRCRRLLRSIGVGTTGDGGGVGMGVEPVRESTCT